MSSPGTYPCRSVPTMALMGPDLATVGRVVLLVFLVLLVLLGLSMGGLLAAEAAEGLVVLAAAALGRAGEQVQVQLR